MKMSSRQNENSIILFYVPMKNYISYYFII